MAAKTGTSEPFASINVTPFVDVVLVLLIIFMATSNYITNPAIEVELPQAASGGEVVETTLLLVLSREGTLFLNGKEATAQQVGTFCKEASAKNPRLQAVVAADGSARHQQVIALIDLIKQNGISSFALNIDPTAVANGH